VGGLELGCSAAAGPAPSIRTTIRQSFRSLRKFFSAVIASLRFDLVSLILFVSFCALSWQLSFSASWRLCVKILLVAVSDPCPSVLKSFVSSLHLCAFAFEIPHPHQIAPSIAIYR